MNELKLFNEDNDNSNADKLLDITLTGFDLKELETLNNLSILKNNRLDDTNTIETNYSNILSNSEQVIEPITELNDLWQLGNHRLLCGDAIDINSVKRLMNNKIADMVFTDPPYNVKISNVVNVNNNDKHHHEEFAMASGEMNEEEYINFLTTIFKNYIAISKNGSIHYICMDWKHIYEILTANRNTYNNFKQLCVWNKDNVGMGTFYRSKHELIFIFKNGTEPNTNNFKLGQYGRHRSNVWDYPSINSFNNREIIVDNNTNKKHFSTSRELEMHPTVKPLNMVMDAILDCSNTNELIVDFFLGSGTTLIAAEKTNRICYGMEISPKYCDVIIKRFEEETGEKAKLLK